MLFVHGLQGELAPSYSQGPDATQPGPGALVRDGAGQSERDCCVLDTLEMTLWTLFLQYFIYTLVDSPLLFQSPVSFPCTIESFVSGFVSSLFLACLPFRRPLLPTILFLYSSPSENGFLPPIH